ncbi:MAG: hypothetical protein HQL97_01405 [Magnetococcales bacterium]|nr:hypothetical protein [Magnetococcales bacterium]MBF0260479.1 hypothetical protein [Magnetococcales bacterium]
MITTEEKSVMRMLQGQTIRKVCLLERNTPNPFRSVAFHFNDGTYLEIYDSCGSMRIAGIRHETRVDREAVPTTP